MTNIIVVGAGFAGLACARKLSKAGMGITVLEARDRVGGRVGSNTLPNGETYELGAEFVLRSYEVLPRLAAELGIALADAGTPVYRREIREPDAPDIDQMMRAERRLIAHMQDCAVKSAQPVSLAEAIETSPLDPAEKRIFVARLTQSFALNISKIDVAWTGMASPSDHPEDADISDRMVGGNQGLANAMAKDLGRAVRLRSPVVSLEQSGSKVRVRLADGQTIEGDAAIVAVPVPLMRELSFTPPLPAAQAKAYDAILFGELSKLSVELEEPVSPQTVFEPSTPFTVFASKGPDGSDQRSVMCVAGGSSAHDTLNLRDGDFSVWSEALLRLMPELKPTGHAVLTQWKREPWTKGSYGVRPLGWTADDEQQLGAVFGRILFAGEHTAKEWAMTMEGALRSGERAAEDVLNLLSPRTA